MTFKPSPRPIFVKDEDGEHLYIRTGNSTRPLTSREAVGYCKQRWPWVNAIQRFLHCA